MVVLLHLHVPSAPRHFPALVPSTPKCSRAQETPRNTRNHLHKSILHLSHLFHLSLFSVHSEAPISSAHPPLRFPAPTPSFGTILRTFPRFRTLRKYSRSQVITLLANSLHSECSGVFSHATSAPSGAFRSEQQAPISAGTTCNDVRASQPKRL